MDKLIAFLITAGLCLIVGLGLVYLVSNSEANRLNAQAGVERARGEAEAMILRAQGQNSLDRAQAYTMTLNSGLPWGVLGVLGVLGLAIVALSFAVIGRSQQNQPRVIERIVVERLPEPKHRMLPQDNHWQLPTQVDYPIEWIERG